ncbi:hypothetical protein PTI98_002879 [Pleurotus ostreatus]|nr:hypothetical protein PTI98_002879 [Pleurotus ostreatus]
MSVVIQVSDTWKGFRSIRNLVIFGDSYSSVRDAIQTPEPTPNLPLGTEWPGFTWNEPDLPNWVGHLLTKYAPGPKYNPTADQQDEAYLAAPLLAYDYAIGGATYSGVRHQVERFLRSDYSKKIDPKDSLFVFWFGINDCAYSSDPKPSLTALADFLDQLYATGARNFLLIDVPPVQNSPAYRGKYYDGRFESWNTELKQTMETFSSGHTDATILIFSSYSIFSAFLNERKKYGFDSKPFSQTIWMDALHPTSKVHGVVAESVSTFLQSVPASS